MQSLAILFVTFYVKLTVGGRKKGISSQYFVLPITLINPNFFTEHKANPPLG